MKASLFITKLQEAVLKHGDLNIRIDYEDIKRVSIAKKETIYISGDKDKKKTYIDIQTSH